MSLPQDIIDYVIAQFGRDAPRPRDLLEDYQSLWTPLVRLDDVPDAMSTLKSLSLVSRDCRRAAIRYIFHTIDITGRNRDALFERLERFYHFLSTEHPSLEPRAATFIRTLSIARDITDSLYPQDPSVDYLFGDDLLAKTFELLERDRVSLTCLQISNGQAGTSINWTEIPIRFRTSLYALVRSPTLKILSLLHFENIPHTLFHNSSLEAVQLAIWSKDNLQPTFPTDENTSHLPNISYLVTNDAYSRTFIKAPWWTAALANLKGCNIDPLYEIDISTLDRTTHSVESLRVDRISWTTVKKYSRVSPFNPFNFGHYTNLRKLSITRCRRMHDRFHGQDEDIMKLVGLLERTDICNNLHSLTVRIMGFYESFAGEDFLVPDVHLAGPSVWEELDRVVASSRFPVLRHFSLEIISTDIEQAPSGKFDVSEMERLTKECFDRSFMRTKALQRVELEWVVKEIYYLDLGFDLGD